MHRPESPPVIEILFRLGIALFLSLCLATLLAWGWSTSDERTATATSEPLTDGPEPSTPAR